MKITYLIHLIQPVEERMVYEVSYNDEDKYATDPYTMHEQGIFILRQQHPFRMLFIPWSNITHVETIKLP